MNQIAIIQRSLRCFILGLVGIVPVLGLPFAAVALADYFELQRRAGQQWNPAAPYLRWGGLLAVVGILLTCLLVAVATVSAPFWLGELD